MTDKASPGWLIQALTLGPNPEGAPSVSDFNVAIADVDQAIAATAKHAAVEKGHLRLLRQLSSTEIVALHLKAGEVKPA